MFALIDCNNFYVSCERAFQPVLNGKPVVVLSNNDGCVISRSKEAKHLGIPMGAPAFKYKHIFKRNEVFVFSSNYPLYGDMSNRVMSTLKGFTDDIELYSIDEAFLKFEDFSNCNLMSYGLHIKSVVLQHARIPVSVGFGSTKCLAKLANRIAKKFPKETKGVYVIDTELKRLKALKWLDIEDVWGIGRRISKRLQNIGVRKAIDFIKLSDAYVRKEFSVVLLRLKKELEGESILMLEDVKAKKNIATSRTFSNGIFDYKELEERVATFSSICGSKLRRQKSECNALMVFVATNRFDKNRSYFANKFIINLPYASNSDITLSKYAKLALKAIYKEGLEYKKAGVILMDFNLENTSQQNLFENENPKHRALMNTMDSLNCILGTNKVKLANQIANRTWIMKQDKLSKKYTTNWNELLEVE